MTTDDKGNENNEPVTPPVTDPNAPPVFTEAQQNHINTIVAQTRRETEGKFGDYADLKKKSDELDNILHEKLTKEEQLTADLAKATSDLAASNSRSDALQIENAISLMASEKGFLNAGDANALVERSGIVRSDTGEITGISDALDTLLESRSYLRKSDKPNAPNLNGGPQNPGDAPVSLSDGQRDAAHRLFSNVPPAEAEVEYAKGIRPK